MICSIPGNFGFQPKSSSARAELAIKCDGSPGRRGSILRSISRPVTFRAASMTSSTENPSPLPRLSGSSHRFRLNNRAPEYAHRPNLKHEYNRARRCRQVSGNRCRKQKRDPSNPRRRSKTLGIRCGFRIVMFTKLFGSAGSVKITQSDKFSDRRPYHNFPKSAPS